MRTFDLIASILVFGGCKTENKNVNDLKQINKVIIQQEIEVKKELSLPIRLSKEEIDSTLGVYEEYRAVMVQVQAARMKYPYIDGASEECERLTEEQMQIKRSNPEISLTCKE